MKVILVFVALVGVLVNAEAEAEADFYSQFPSASPPYSTSSPFISNFHFQCRKNNEFFDRCASPCDETCENTQNYNNLIKEKDDCTLKNCVPKCMCVSGFVRQNGECVPKTQCGIVGNVGQNNILPGSFYPYNRDRYYEQNNMPRYPGNAPNLYDYPYMKNPNSELNQRNWLGSSGIGMRFDENVYDTHSHGNQYASGFENGNWHDANNYFNDYRMTV
ncbi:sperm mitochondrial-associated cysteine-rich protein [Sergentomyia squamirostris]